MWCCSLEWSSWLRGCSRIVWTEVQVCFEIMCKVWSIKKWKCHLFYVPETWGSTKSRICSSVPSDSWRTSTHCKCLMLASTHTGLYTHWRPHTLNHSRKKQFGLRCKNVERTPARFQISTSHRSLMKSFPSNHTLGLIFTPPKFSLSPSQTHGGKDRQRKRDHERLTFFLCFTVFTYVGQQVILYIHCCAI